MKTLNNDIEALEALTGTDFHTTYLERGNTITMFQYEESFILLDNDMFFIHTNIECMTNFDREAFSKGYKKGALEMFKKEGVKTIFSA